MPRVLQGAFGKKRPPEAPQIPDYDTFLKRYNDKVEINDPNTKVEEFRTDAWWLKKDAAPTPSVAEIKVGGNKALNHDLPETMNIQPTFDEETESQLREYFYGDGDVEIE